MRLAFMGTPEFSAPILGELLAAGHDVAAVYSQPPRPAGRGKALRKSPVHAAAEAHGLPVRTPAALKAQEDRDAFAALDLDVAVVAAYGLILPKPILNAPRLGCLNLHASLLPRWRGAAPIQRAIMAGDAITGVQVMQMEPGLDTGPVLLSETTPIGEGETAGDLEPRLSTIAASLIGRALAALERGALTPTPQAQEGVVYAHKIDKAEARIAWDAPADEVDRRIRGLSPAPGAWFEAPDAEGRPTRVKVLRSKRGDPATTGAPGTIRVSDGRAFVQCAPGEVELLALQRAGKGVQDTATFLRGFPLDVASSAGA